jgi:hypothetical protein
MSQIAHTGDPGAPRMKRAGHPKAPARESKCCVVAGQSATSASASCMKPSDDGTWEVVNNATRLLIRVTGLPNGEPAVREFTLVGRMVDEPMAT